MKLYHFTSVRHMKEIERCGSIKTTYSDIRPDGAGPGVVWLTTNPKPKQGWTEIDAPVFVHERYGVRITVEVPEKEAHSYPEWSRKMGIDPKWFKLYTERDRDFVNWYVVTRPIGRSKGAVEMVEGFRDGSCRGTAGRCTSRSTLPAAAGPGLIEGSHEPRHRSGGRVGSGAGRGVAEDARAMKRRADATERLLGESGIRRGGRKAKR